MKHGRIDRPDAGEIRVPGSFATRHAARRYLTASAGVSLTLTSVNGDSAQKTSFPLALLVGHVAEEDTACSDREQHHPQTVR